MFGTRSPIYSDVMAYLDRKVVSNKKEFDLKYKEWATIFEKIYGGSLDKSLFLNHTYFALILKSLFLIKLCTIQNLEMEEAYEDCVTNNLEPFHIYEFEMFFWTDLSRKMFKRIFDTIESGSFFRGDLFYELYQQIFLAETRHKIGEFYTPTVLAKKMIDDDYDFGLKVLDPACGSGNFLIEIIVKILNSDKPNALKYMAINNLYGFDLNPLATMTAKINIFLLFLEYFNFGEDEIPNINVFLMDSLFPEEYERKMIFNLKKLYGSFDLIVGNPPWLTYKDIREKTYQTKLRELTEKLGIKPASQYITHIEFGAVFFYAIPAKFLKVGGKIFFVLTKSVLNGDHCYEFRAFLPFKNLELWEFPNSYMFNVEHICLKAEYLGFDNGSKITDKYPIIGKIVNGSLEFQAEKKYSSFSINEKGAKLILPEDSLKTLHTISFSPYFSKFHQGATLVPKTLVFFQIEKKENEFLIISSDNDIVLRAKKQWQYFYQNKEIEKIFSYKTFLNKNLIPFYLKQKKHVFLPLNEKFELEMPFLQTYTKAHNFYREMNEFYQKNKKSTSDIETLFSNINYWNKLTKQRDLQSFIVVYNASGSSIKAAVLKNMKKKLIIGSENYYYSTNSKNEAYYLCAILNSPRISESIKLIKSSRHIHKRPFSFPIPLYEENNEVHDQLARKALKCESIARNLFAKNSNINSEKVRLIMRQKLDKVNALVDQIVFR